MVRLFLLGQPLPTGWAMPLVFLGLLIHATANADSEEDKAKQQRLQFMTEKARDLRFSFAAKPDRLLTLTEPVSRFSNPVRDAFSDGAIFLWLSGTRPVAAASLWIRANGEFGRDFGSCSAAPLRCADGDQIVWSPRSGLLVNRQIDDAPEPGRTPQQRISQMRQLARRFKGSIGAWPAEGFRELRLLPRPIYRYSSETDGVTDGAVFALVQANDPEVLIMIESSRTASADKAVWQYSLARMSAIRMKVRLDDREVLAVDGYWRKPRSPNDPYIEIIEKYAPAASK